ncbi:hypothetical protein RF11_04992 [Thelohanellus kitauei]|uniref:Uncharacterized protein n=1 Tax=Thelohanellus kitauei TaxID=669202 RepID=A0A0C2N2L6_THEKT|nr:hypothetical protein RF11_04992 [Thelohanellus kitauei]
MELYSVSVHATEKTFEKKMAYTITKSAAQTCTAADKLDAPYQIGAANYQSLFFASFYYSDYFMVEHFIIKSGVAGSGEATGALDRASMGVTTASSDANLPKPSSLPKLDGNDLPGLLEGQEYGLTFMNHHDKNKAFYILPPPKGSLKLKK